MFLKSDGHAIYKDKVCFKIGAKLKKFAKNAHFANFGPPF